MNNKNEDVKPKNQSQLRNATDDDNTPEIDTKNLVAGEDDRPRRDGPGGN